MERKRRYGSRECPACSRARQAYEDRSNGHAAWSGIGLLAIRGACSVRGIRDEVGNAESVRCRGALRRFEVARARERASERRSRGREARSCPGSVTRPTQGPRRKERIENGAKRIVEKASAEKEAAGERERGGKRSRKWKKRRRKGRETEDNCVAMGARRWRRGLARWLPGDEARSIWQRRAPPHAYRHHRPTVRRLGNAADGCVRGRGQPGSHTSNDEESDLMPCTHVHPGTRRPRDAWFASRLVACLLACLPARFHSLLLASTRF